MSSTLTFASVPLHSIIPLENMHSKTSLRDIKTHLCAWNFTVSLSGGPTSMQTSVAILLSSMYRMPSARVLPDCHPRSPCVVMICKKKRSTHWRRLVKNIGRKQTQQNWGASGGNNWWIHGRFSIIGAARAPAAPKVYAYGSGFSPEAPGKWNVLRDQQDMAKILETNLAHSMGWWPLQNYMPTVRTKECI